MTSKGSRTFLGLVRGDPLARHVEEFFVALEAAGCARLTVDWYADNLYRFWQNGSLLTRASIEGYLAMRRKHVSASTVLGDLRTLRRYCNFLIDRGYLSENPCNNLVRLRKQETTPRIADGDVAQLLLAGAQKSRHPLRDQAIVMVLADTGARVSEFLRIDMGTLHVIAGKGGPTGEAWVMGKGNRLRRLLIGPVAMQALQAWVVWRPPEAGDTIWWAENNHPLTDWGIRQILRRLAHTVGYKGPVNPHAFRHGSAIDAITEGLDLRTVQMLLGHRDIQTTVIYLRLADKQLERAHDLISKARFGKEAAAAVVDNTAFAVANSDDPATQTAMQRAIGDYFRLAPFEDVSAATKRTYQWHLEKFKAWAAGQLVFAPGDLTGAQLEAWRASLSARWQRATCKVAHAAVQAFLTWCAAQGLIAQELTRVLDLRRRKAQPIVAAA